MTELLTPSSLASADQARCRLSRCAALLDALSSRRGRVGVELAACMRDAAGVPPSASVDDPEVAGRLVTEWRLASSLAAMCFEGRAIEDLEPDELAAAFAVDPEHARRWLIEEQDLLVRAHEVIDVVLAGSGRS